MKTKIRRTADRMIKLEDGTYIRLSKYVGLDPHSRRPTGDGKVHMKNPKRSSRFYTDLVKHIEDLDYMDVLRVPCSFERRIKTSTIISYHFNKIKVLRSYWYKNFLYILCIEPVKGQSDEHQGFTGQSATNRSSKTQGADATNRRTINSENSRTSNSFS